MIPHLPKTKQTYKKSTNTWLGSVQFSSFAQSCPTLWPHESQHARPPCLSPTPGVHSDSHPLNQWCHPAILSSVVPFSSCPQSLPASESFPMSQLFAWGGQSTGVSALASFLPKIHYLKWDILILWNAYTDEKMHRIVCSIQITIF